MSSQIFCLHSLIAVVEKHKKKEMPIRGKIQILVGVSQRHAYQLTVALVSQLRNGKALAHDKLGCTKVGVSALFHVVHDLD